MATPEVYLMQCDNKMCEAYLPSVLSDAKNTTASVLKADHSPTRGAARKYAASMGWYIGDEELCPRCAAKRGKHGEGDER